MIESFEYEVTGLSKMRLKANVKDGSSTLMNTKVLLDVSSNVEEKSFFIENKMPNAVGCKVLTNTFIQGLIGNIHYSHNNGFRDSADHLRYIISELEKGFVAIPEITKGKF